MYNIHRKHLRRVSPIFVGIIALAGAVFGWLAFDRSVAASSQTEIMAGPFRQGERISYSVSFEKFRSIAYAETYVVSRGRLADKDAVEIRGKFKTKDLVSAAFYYVDESRTVFASPDSGLPYCVSREVLTGGLPKETVDNYIQNPTQNFDLLTLLFKIRASGGAGAATLGENDRVFTATFAPTGAERVKTDIGEFDTSVISVQSEYFVENGLRDVRINLSNDEARVPVAIRFRAPKGEFRLEAASITIEAPEAAPEATPVPTPRPLPTPQATPTPAVYVDNRPLSPELSFELGETLEYRLASGGQAIGSFKLEARERKMFRGLDTLLLQATVTESLQPGTYFTAGDIARAYVDPETLAPYQVDVNFRGSLNALNLSATFDQAASRVTQPGREAVELPVGTQSLLSLLYAARSFNLKPSKDLNNPVNDTRVAVFWDGRAYVFTLRPSAAELITLGGEKLSAQLIAVSTGGQNPQIDQLQIKVWLSNDEKRTPLRFSAGTFQADLVSTSNPLTK